MTGRKTWELRDLGRRKASFYKYYDEALKDHSNSTVITIDSLQLLQRRAPTLCDCNYRGSIGIADDSRAWSKLPSGMGDVVQYQGSYAYELP